MSNALTRTIIRSITIVAPFLLIFAITVTTRSLLHSADRPTQAILVPVTTSLVLYSVLSYLPLLVEDVLNRGGVPFPEVHLQNARKHLDRFDVADLHCDTLLWGGRDFLKTTRHPIMTNRTIGAVDLPRMFEGRVKLQVFAAVNSIPRTINYARNPKPHAIADALVLKTILERWPPRTWFSPKQRVLYQFQRLSAAAKKNSRLLKITRSKAELQHNGEAIEPIRALMAVEGLSCLNEDIKTVNEFFAVGIRILGPTHFFDTEVGGSSSGFCNCGITTFGRDVLHRMKRLGMIVDLAHASDKLIKDILDISAEERPHVMISHTGIDAVCPSQRNLGDELIIRIADAGGLVGIALFDPALCGDDLIQSFVKSVRHASNILGNVQSIALGSDWDGNVLTAVSAADTHVLSTSLLEIGNFSSSEVQRIMHDNAFEFFKKSLPG